MMEEKTKSFWDNESIEITDELLNGSDMEALSDVLINEDKYAEEAPDIVTETDVYNIYRNLFNGDINYSGRLSNIFHCTNINMIDSMMKEFVDAAFKYGNANIADEEEKKKFISTIYSMSVAYSSGSFIKDSYCHPLLNFYINKMQNKMDKYCSEVRFNRCKDDFETFMKKTGINFDSVGIIYATSVILVKYGFVTTDESQKNVPKYIFVLLSQYVKNIKDDDYINRWLVLSFIANLIRMSVMTEKDINANPKLLERQTNLARFIIFIWKHSSPDTFVEPYNNTVTADQQEPVESELPPIPDI